MFGIQKVYIINNERGSLIMIGRRNINNTWKEEWELIVGLNEVKHINKPIEIKLDDILIEFETINKSGYTSSGTYNYNVVEYCAYIPYSNNVFNGYNMNDEYITENENLLDDISLIRDQIEMYIEEYLRNNNFIEVH